MYELLCVFPFENFILKLFNCFTTSICKYVIQIVISTRTSRPFVQVCISLLTQVLLKKNTNIPQKHDKFIDRKT